MNSPGTRFFTAGKEEKHSKKSKKKGKKQKFLFKNDNYSDSYPLTPPHDQIMQNSRGGVTLMYDHKRMNNGELVTSPAPVRDSYTASDVAGPSNGLLHPGPHEDDIDSFASGKGTKWYSGGVFHYTCDYSLRKVRCISCSVFFSEPSP